MRDQFSSYFRPSENQIKALWRDCIFTFDTSTLLTLYEQAKDTCTSFLNVIKSVQDRCWIPHQVALEFHNGRIGVIKKQASKYKDVSDQVKAIIRAFEDKKSHPFFSSQADTETTEALKKILKDLNIGESSLRKQFNTDTVLDTLIEVFNRRTGSTPSGAKVEELISTGEKRYLRETPPGYLDRDKGGARKYGDYIAWQQILDYSQDKKSPMILVIDDMKDDWWRTTELNTKTPRPELLDEFNSYSGNMLHMYNTGEFLENATVHLNSDIKKSAIDEAHKLSKLKAREDEMLSNTTVFSPLEANIAPLNARATTSFPLNAMPNFPYFTGNATVADNTQFPMTYELLRYKFTTDPQFRDKVLKAAETILTKPEEIISNSEESDDD